MPVPKAVRRMKQTLCFLLYFTPDVIFGRVGKTKCNACGKPGNRFPPSAVEKRNKSGRFNKHGKNGKNSLTNAGGCDNMLRLPQKAPHPKPQTKKSWKKVMGKKLWENGSERIKKVLDKDVFMW